MLFRSATSESNAATSETNAKQSETNAGDYAAVATTAATEAVDAMERATDLAGGDFATHEYVDQKVASVTLMDTGSPEGRIAAPVGSVYTDSAATNGAIRWVKTSGTGTAGWRVEYGDTGWRNVSSLLIGDWTATTIQIRRENNLVTLRAQGLGGTTAGFLRLSAPFVTSVTNLNITTSSKVENVFSNSSFALSWRAPGSVNSDASYWAQGTWRVASAWPTILPGTPV